MLDALVLIVTFSFAADFDQLNPHWRNKRQRLRIGNPEAVARDFLDEVLHFIEGALMELKSAPQADACGQAARRILRGFRSPDISSNDYPASEQSA